MFSNYPAVGHDAIKKVCKYTLSPSNQETSSAPNVQTFCISKYKGFICVPPFFLYCLLARINHYQCRRLESVGPSRKYNDSFSVPVHNIHYTKVSWQLCSKWGASLQLLKTNNLLCHLCERSFCSIFGFQLTTLCKLLISETPLSSVLTSEELGCMKLAFI